MSSFPSINTIFASTSTTIQYQYPKAVVTNIDFNTDLDKMYLTSSYELPAAISLVSNNNAATYNATNLYIYGKIHNIDGIDFDGELVIRHVGNDQSVVYSCFLLKKSALASNEIDMLINTPETVSLTLNDFIDVGKAIYYTSTNKATVIIHSTPIPVSMGTNFKDRFINSTDKFDKFSKSFEICPTKKSTASIIEGFEAKDDSEWLECSYAPIDASNIAMYSIPLESGYVDDSGRWAMLQSTVNFSISLIFFIAIYYFIPNFYQMIVIDQIYVNDDKEVSVHPGSDTDGKNRVFRRLATIDVLAMLSFFFYGGWLLMTGAGKVRDDYATAMGSFIVLTGLASFVLVQSWKSTGSFHYPEDPTVSLNYPKDFKYFSGIAPAFNFKDIFTFIRNPYMRTFLSMYNIVFVFSFFIFLIMIYAMYKTKNDTASTAIAIVSWLIVFYISPLATSIAQRFGAKIRSFV